MSTQEVLEVRPVETTTEPAKPKQGMFQTIKNIWATIVNWVFGAVAVLTIPYLIVAMGIPMATGAENLNVLTGSMTPNINVGDKIFSQPVDTNTLKIGDVITYLPSDNRTGGVTIVHRIKDFVYDDGKMVAIITKGDANPVQDPPVLPKQVTGKIISIIPYGGYPFMWLHNQQMPPATWDE